MVDSLALRLFIVLSRDCDTSRPSLIVYALHMALFGLALRLSDRVVVLANVLGFIVLV
jgi:hypothetical protein